MTNLQWVKAETRMPDSTINVIFRDINTRAVYRDFHGMQNDTMFFEGRNDDLYVDIKTVEWLSEPPSSIEGEESAELLQCRGLLHEVLVRCGVGLPAHEELVDLFDKGFGGEHALMIELHEALFTDEEHISNPKPCELRPQRESPSPAPIEQEKSRDDKTDGEKLNEVCPIKEVVCPACGGDGKETCNNPDHHFIDAMPGEIGRLGCPVCGHDPNYKVNKGRNTCPLCGGLGHVIYEVADEYGRETGYDEEFIPYPPSAPTCTAREEGEVPDLAHSTIPRISPESHPGALYESFVKSMEELIRPYKERIAELEKELGIIAGIVEGLTEKTK